MSLYLSRLTISRKTPAACALKALIDPLPAGAARDRLHDPAQGRIMDAHHRLIWSLFGDGPDRTRDFLWRAEDGGRFLALSARRPADDGAGLFDRPEVKEFAPDLRPGDRLAFVLRANATRTWGGSGARGKRVDVVMDAIHALPSGDERRDARMAAAHSDVELPPVLTRRDARMAAAQEAGQCWLERQGKQAGFDLEQFFATDYSVAPLPAYRGKREKQPQFGVLSMTGQISVTDPARLIGQIAQGFGRARAFGCGLMLIRRA